MGLRRFRGAIFDDLGKIGPQKGKTNDAQNDENLDVNFEPA